MRPGVASPSCLGAVVVHCEPHAVQRPPDDRSPLAVAMSWVSIAIAISLQMALPALLGVALDRWLATRPVFTTLGAIGGLVLGMYGLLRIAGKLKR